MHNSESSASLSGVRSVRSRLTIAIHCATGVRDMGWLFPQDVCAEVWIEERGHELEDQILARARTGVCQAGGSNPVWSGEAGSILTFDISCGEGIDLSQLGTRIELICANTILENEVIAVAQAADLSQVADSLPRDLPLYDRDGIDIGGALTISIRDESLETSPRWEPPLAAVLKILDEKDFLTDEAGLPPLAKAVPLAAPTVAIPIGSMISQAQISSSSAYNRRRRRRSSRENHGGDSNDRSSSSFAADGGGGTGLLILSYPEFF